MKTGRGLLIACLFAVSCAVGPSEFRSAGCQACHLNTASGSGPSIQEIQEAYQGDAEEVAAFLRGERRPRVDPVRFAAMQPGLAIAKRWSAEERMRVAQFLAGNSGTKRQADQATVDRGRRTSQLRRSMSRPRISSRLRRI